MVKKRINDVKQRTGEKLKRIFELAAFHRTGGQYSYSGISAWNYGLLVKHRYYFIYNDTIFSICLSDLFTC